MTWVQIALALSSSGVIVAVIQALKERAERKANAPIASVQADTAIKADLVGMSDSLAARALAMTEVMQARMNELHQRVDRLEAARIVALDHIRVLEDHINAQLPPPPPPRPKDL